MTMNCASTPMTTPLGLRTTSEKSDSDSVMPMPNITTPSSQGM